MADDVIWASCVDLSPTMSPMRHVVTPSPSEIDENSSWLVPDVRKGEHLPLLPAGTKIEIPPPKLRQVKAIIDETMLPDEMKDSSAVVWKNESLLQQKIKEILPLGAKTKISRRVPQCLILDAPTLRELLIVLNWWLSLSPNRKAKEFKLLRNTYKRPTKSNERMPPPSKVVLSTDKQEVLDEHAWNSASARRLEAGKRQHRMKGDALDFARHVMAKPIRSLVAKAQSACQDLMDEIANLPPGVDFECGFVLKRNVGTLPTLLLATNTVDHSLTISILQCS